MEDADLAGRTLADRYDLFGLLGAGGMGAVYRARDRELDEIVALKVIRGDRARDAATVERFRREVKLARRVTHKNVARTFELGNADGIVYCTMELIDGESLAARLARGGALPAPEAVAIARAVCDALTAAHGAGVIHRDIKPANVLIASDGRVVLADFGIAATTVTSTGEVSGTPAYMAPEQTRGEPAAPATDVYAVGVLLHEMVTGACAFAGPTAEVFEAKRAVAQLDTPGCPPELARVIARATARELPARIATAETLARELASLHRAPPSSPPALATDELAPRTVIVLPPRGDASHLALAVHEAVLARLGRVSHVRALSRSSTAEPADSVVELVVGDTARATIGRGDRPVVVVELPVSVGDLDAAASAIASAVAGAVQAIAPPLSAAGAEALDLTLRARERMQRGFEGTHETLAMLTRASELDTGPRTAAMLAYCEVRAAFLFDDASPERLARARVLVRRALAAAPERAEAQVAAGHLMLHLGKPTTAARHFREAIARAPHMPDGHEHLGRMLLEAGFVDHGLARLDAALAIAPALGPARWDIARTLALLGRWDECDRLVAELSAQGADRWATVVRFALWRRDDAAVARLRARTAKPAGELAAFMHDVAEGVVVTGWPATRPALLALAFADTATHRRRAFVAQLAAEVAGYFGDVELCAAMVVRAADAGAFDLPWIDGCPVLDAVRATPAVADARAVIARRAEAILDALYGDTDDTELPATSFE